VTDLSVIIVSYNTRELLLQCLSSVLRALVSVTHEVIVVDNGSADGSPDAVEKKFPQLHLIRNQENRGFARAVNQGLQKAGGRYFLLLNSDALIDSEALTKMISFMEKTPDAGAVGGQLVRKDGTLQNSFDNCPTLCTELLNKSLLKRLFPKRYPGKHLKFTGPVEVESLIGACMMARREVLNSVGMLDESFFFFLEETDWCLRMREKGWKVYFLPFVNVRHLQGRSANKEPVSARIEFYRSRYKFFSLHRSRVSQVILRAGLFTNLCIEVFYSLLISLASLFFYRKEVVRLRVRLSLLFGHLLGCSRRQGLAGRKVGR
jgi:GT2 family glycosyltransferase